MKPYASAEKANTTRPGAACDSQSPHYDANGLVFRVSAGLGAAEHGSVRPFAPTESGEVSKCAGPPIGT